MKRSLAIAIAFLVILSSAAAQQVFKLVSPDKSFSVSFPGEPRHERNASDQGPFHIEGHSYTFETSASKFVLSYAQLTPAPIDLKPNDAIDSAISGTIENVSGKLLAQKPVNVRGKPARAVTIAVGENTVIDGRFVYVNPRVYQLLVLHRPGATPSFEQRFFDSFTASTLAPPHSN
jgi:hypothetical protein